MRDKHQIWWNVNFLSEFNVNWSDKTDQKRVKESYFKRHARCKYIISRTSPTHRTSNHVYTNECARGEVQTLTLTWTHKAAGSKDTNSRYLIEAGRNQKCPERVKCLHSSLRLWHTLLNQRVIVIKQTHEVCRSLTLLNRLCCSAPLFYYQKDTRLVPAEMYQG